jgi:hypothetical protein
MASDPSARRKSLAELKALGYSRPPKATMLMRGQARTVEQIVHTAPSLAALAQIAQQGQARIKAISSLLPASLRNSVQSGGVDEGSWCLLVPHNAAAAKLRQLLPALAAHLRTKGFNTYEIKIKVQQK